MRKADNLPPYCAVAKKSRNLNFLDPSGPAWPVTGVLYLSLFTVFRCGCSALVNPPQQRISFEHFYSLFPVTLVCVVLLSDKYSKLFTKNLIRDNIYVEGTVIILIHFLCKRKTLLIYLELPQKITPYVTSEWKYAGYIFKVCHPRCVCK